MCVCVCVCVCDILVGQHTANTKPKRKFVGNGNQINFLIHYLYVKRFSEIIMISV